MPAVVERKKKQNQPSSKNLLTAFCVFYDLQKHIYAYGEETVAIGHIGEKFRLFLQSHETQFGSCFFLYDRNRLQRAHKKYRHHYRNESVGKINVLVLRFTFPN